MRLRSFKELDEIKMIEKCLNELYEKRHVQPCKLNIIEAEETTNISHDGMTSFIITLKGHVLYEAA